MASTTRHPDQAHDTNSLECESSANDPINISLPYEELAAVEGWRAANLIASLPDAVRELVRIGLLSEIAKVHQLVADIRASVTERTTNLNETRN